ncbi:hypothetical protein, variant 1 [Phytophthora nicotianae]|uniref:FYVE-type domain-containing protein n=1 Tax=Phytophthora nicotianae TaxID=4792 RepID=W2HTS0_PHYNI|nr:hypothetical protein L915_20882 [Phytophthora nicotianae]ETK71958.1 hypothetical protein, variant 1 [Phytophthora nicotianae]ETL25384.1 hypothetical protein L916_20765 [Phytophthora nicotianae]ETL25385.1 hypothetical protein, variant 1 [Phytophthora nicotianae]
MGEIIVSERERLDLIQQGDHVFLEAQERLYDAKKQRAVPESKDRVVSTLDTFTVYGSLDEVTELYLNTDKKMVLDFSESRELAVLKPDTMQRPLDRTSLRWALSHSPSRLIAKDQDFCYLEIMKPYGTADGRRGWAKVSHSIKHKACPEFRDSQGVDVNRAELLYCGLFFEETDALGVLNATVYYNTKGDTTPSVLMPMVQKARSKRTIELVNHYLKMSNMILKSRKISLTRALQLQGEKRCAACANYLSMWKPKDKCVMCGSYLCDKCTDIVTRNYRVDDAKGQVACFSCSHRRGKKIMLETETGYNDLDSSGNSGSAVKVFTKTHSILESDQQGGLRDGSISSLNSEEQPRWFDDEGKPSLELAQDQQQQQPKPQRQEPPQQKPQRLEPPQQHRPQQMPQQRKLSKQTSTPARSSEFIPHQTFFLPTDQEEQQRRRCNTRVSTRRPAKALDEDFIARRRSRTTGNSRLSSRAKPTGCAPGTVPSKPKESPITFDTPVEEPMDFAPVGNQVGLNLEELNYRMRRYTTNAIPVQPMDWTDQGVRTSTRCHTVDGTRKHERYQQPNRLSARPSAPAFTPAMMDFTKTPSIRYSKQNPCDLSYLASFK